MDPILVVAVAAVVGVVCFVAGVVFSKTVLSEASAIKQHVTDAESRIRADVAAALAKVSSKV